MSKQPPKEICTFAQEAQKQWKVPACVQLGQWILESGWGAHSPGNNPFGMKPRKGKNDPQQMLLTTEYIKGKRVKIPQPFRVFPSVKEAFLAHAELLATALVYKPAMDALPDVDKFIDKMSPRYATDPNYAKNLKSIIKSQGLRQYDL